MALRPPALLLLAVALLALGTGCRAPFPIEERAKAAWTATAMAAPPTATATPTPTATPRVTPTLVLAPRATPSPATDLDQIASRVAALRGLPLKSRVPMGTLTRDELRGYLIRSYEKENAREALERDKAILVLLDLVKESDDLYELSIEALTEQIFGFYDFETREMKLIGAGATLSPREELSLVHEYVHALQDQHFDLGGRLKEAKGSGERSLALRSLSEGDATLFMGLYGQTHMTPEQRDAATNGGQAGVPGQEGMRQAPPVMGWQLLFPYLRGMAFAMSLYQKGGVAEIQRAFTNPPVTSEQILHAQKYWANEGPQGVDLPDLAPALGDGWSKWHEDTMGEFGLWCYLRGGLSDEPSSRASDGWGDDRLALYRNAEGKVALALATSWDAPQEAEQFFAALGELYRARKSVGVTAQDGHSFTWLGSGRSGYVGMREKQVVVAISPDEGTTGRMVSGLASLLR